MAAFTSFHIFARITEASALRPAMHRRRLWWLALAGASTGSGIWATHFVGMLACNAGVPTAYEVLATIASLVIAVLVTTVGFWTAARGGKHDAALGGAVIGAGISAMHFVGMQALVVQGGLEWNLGLCAVAVGGGMVLAASAMAAYEQLARRWALWVAPVLLTLAVCVTHVTAMGAVTVVPDPTILVRPSLVQSHATALAIAGVAILIMLAAFGAAFINAMAQKEVEGELRTQRDDLRRREEDLHTQNERFDLALNNMAHGLCMVDGEQRLVVCNRQYAQMYRIPAELTRPGTPLEDILDLRMAGGMQTACDADTYLRQRLSPVLEPSVRIDELKDGRVIQVTLRPMGMGGSIAVHEDITERQRLYAQLERQNALLQQREEELKARHADLDTALAYMTNGLAMFDADERIIVANARYAEIYGLPPESTQPGTTLRHIIELRVAAGFYSGRSVDNVLLTTRALIASKTTNEVIGRPRPDLVLSVSTNPRGERGWVVTLNDITERETLSLQLARQNKLLKEREEQLGLQNARFDTAVNNMTQGLCLYDADQRVVIANRRYAEMYGLPYEYVRPGTTLRQMLEARAARGVYGEIDAAEYVRSGIAAFGQKLSMVVKLPDGRVMSVVRLPMPDGGLVTTHEDITEREHLNTQLAEQHELLKAKEEQLRAQNLQLDAALNNMVQGLAMFDADVRLVVCNGRFADLYGLSPEQVKPGTSLLEILQHRVANGDLTKTTAEVMCRSMLDRIDDRSAAQFVSELEDGRCIAVALQPMAGGGTVTTHQDITEQRRSEAKIVHMALHDTLTGLPNRVLLNERLEHALSRVARGDIVACHLLDLDYFKNVNDTLGHPAGDKLLCQVAARLRTLVRESDTIARMGGDEFAIVQEALAQPSDATNLAHRIIEVLSQPYEIDGQQVVIGTSVGIAIGPADGLTPDQLIRNSDLALYRAKGEGRSTFCFFEPEMDAQMQARRSMENDLRKALAAGEFELYYQPIVNLKSNEITSLEALVRWHRPGQGTILPMMFIPLAEEIGFIVPLGKWVLREACAAAQAWPRHLTVSVNLSPAQFRSAGLVQMVLGALAASGLAPDRLELEITETVLLGDSDATLATLFQLRALGVRIAMDDFGTGYSSLSYLQSFPFDKIKIDRSFVADITEGAGSLNIVRAVTAMAQGLGMTTTAEGVETSEQLEMVRSEGCTEMQGFLFSQPLRASEIDKLLADYKDGRPAIGQNAA